MENREIFENEPRGQDPTGESVSQETRPGWYVDLRQEDFVRFRLLLARVNGPLRMRVPTLIMALLCCLTMVALVIEDWYVAGWQGYPNPILLAGAVLVLLPGLYVWFYLPAQMKKAAAAQYERSVNSGMNYCGRLTVTDQFIEKAGVSATAHVRLDERTLFIESEDLMIFSSPTSPALVLPAWCLTEEMATAVRHAADRLPTQNRRFIARLIPGGQVIPCLPETEKPEEVWVTTFTYTAAEHTSVLRQIILQHFWKASPMTAVTATAGALLFGWEQETWWMCAVYFLIIAGIMTVMSLVLPMLQAKRQSENLSNHDRTLQVRFDTLALRVKGQKTQEVWALWCDVDHVYDKDTFVEIVHNKNNSVHIPKRAIEDLSAFEAALDRCRGKITRN